jgi:sulfur-oxidizing protein SoxB
MLGITPHLVGEQLLRSARIQPGTLEAHAFTHLNFEQAAKTYGRVGGLT